MKMNERRMRAQLQISIIMSSLFLIMGYITHAPATKDPASSAESFKKASQVFLHPRCVNCHPMGGNQSPGMQAPPGGPDWQLPAKHMSMVFEGRTPRQLCEQLKDPKQNGNMPVEKIVDRVREAAHVHWGWNPGEGRAPVPMPHSEFVKYMDEWVRTGAACPE